MNQPRMFNSDEQEQIGHYAVEHFPPIAQRLDNVLASLVDANSIPYSKEKSADHMALAFVTKQREHLKTVCLLIDAEAHREAFLVTRIMVEGSGMLRWAFLDLPTRSDLWFWFGAIRDFRQIHQSMANGRTVDPDEVAELTRLVGLHGPVYYRPDVCKAIRKAAEASKPHQMPTDPWRNRWHEISVQAMFREIDDEVTYEKVYRNSSEWIHWDPRTILRAMEMGPRGTKGFTEKDWRAAGIAFPQACQALKECMQVLNRHFSLGIQSQLDAINTEMIRILNQAIAETIFHGDSH